MRHSLFSDSPWCSLPLPPLLPPFRTKTITSNWNYDLQKKATKIDLSMPLHK